jgi:hypothetical protein
MNNRIIVGALLLGGLAVAGLGLGAAIAQADAPIAWSSPKSLPALRFPVPLSHIIGAITCDSEPAGVTCTDISTGHFFRVSRDSYQLG